MVPRLSPGTTRPELSPARPLARSAWRCLQGGRVCASPPLGGTWRVTGGHGPPKFFQEVLIKQHPRSCLATPVPSRGGKGRRAGPGRGGGRAWQGRACGPSIRRPGLAARSHRCGEPTWRPVAGRPGPAATSPHVPCRGLGCCCCFAGGLCSVVSGACGPRSGVAGRPEAPSRGHISPLSQRWPAARRLADGRPLPALARLHLPRSGWPSQRDRGYRGQGRGRSGQGSTGHAGSPTAGVSGPFWGDSTGLSPEPGAPTGPLGPAVPRGGQRACRACGRQVQRAWCRPGSRVLTVTVTTRWALASTSPPVKMGETQPPTRLPGESRKWKDRAACPAGPRRRGSPSSSRPCPTPSLQAVTPALTVGMVAEGPGVPRWPGGSPFSPTLPPGICSTPTA